MDKEYDSVFSNMELQWDEDIDYNIPVKKKPTTRTGAFGVEYKATTNRQTRQELAVKKMKCPRGELSKTNVTSSIF